jgi:hypothetical protein
MYERAEKTVAGEQLAHFCTGVYRADAKLAVKP